MEQVISQIKQIFDSQMKLKLSKTHSLTQKK